MQIPDYHSITEAPGLSATAEQRERLYHRYRFARDFVVGKRVLEAACGSGMGLAFLADKASLVIGGDIDTANLRLAVSCNANPKITVNRLDAHHLPFGSRVFDVLVLFESLYYLESPETFIREAARVLRENGCLIIGTVNKDWADFHPSPFAHRYFSVPELDALLRRYFTEVRIYGAFPAERTGVKSALLSWMKRMAVQFNLIPGSLAARAYLKRLFIGPVKPLPDSLQDGILPYMPPEPVDAKAPDTKYKIIYALARGGVVDQKNV